MSADIASYLATACGVSDVDRALQVELFDESGEVIGISVHVVAVEGLSRPSVTTPVVRDRPISIRREEVQLVVPRVGIERPTVTEYNRLTLAPILVKDLRSVSGFDRWHLASLWHGCVAPRLSASRRPDVSLHVLSLYFLQSFTWLS